MRTRPFFKNYSDSRLYDPNQDVLATNPELLNKLLAEAIPVLSRATGRNSIKGWTDAQNIDLMTMKRSDGVWPAVRISNKDWLHGDFRDVAYFYNYKLYDNIVTNGGLK